ncbi:homoserine O-acetyltransferase [Caballeronia catudaia]|uniref:Homoserine O-acetyltransferase n=1 Tax=Caballeronia catudaia TaxID=1777136 RepID=A0A158BTQ5_9BURK|nr:alpha/beta fold hydrolase [Caballeronia catudaia]SAK73361.1 homoserine O-acetyltransferase [Caballeronia catudaia]
MRPLLFAMLLLLVASSACGQDHERSGDVVIGEFRVQDGSVLPQLKLHYVTLGEPARDANGGIVNAVLLLHDTIASSRAYLTADMRRELFAPGAPLDAARYYIVIPDAIGHGASGKPSDGLRMDFPNYGYRDMVEAQYRLVTEGLHIAHLRLVLGTAMGGMHAWLWGERHPTMMDALMPIASVPVAIAGRNAFWRRMIVAAIRRDPEWNDGRYGEPPIAWLRAMPVFTLMTENPARMNDAAPDGERAAWYYDASVYRARGLDANDTLYAFEASRDYDPEPDLARIEARVLAVNFADDLTTPGDTGAIQRVLPGIARARYVEVPESDQTYGTQSIAHPALWKRYVDALLKSAPPRMAVDSSSQQE